MGHFPLGEAPMKTTGVIKGEDVGIGVDKFRINREKFINDK